MALGASAITVLGAMLIAGATVSPAESASTVRAIRRECDRYGMDVAATLQTQEVQGIDPPGEFAPANHRSWFDYLVLLAAVAVFVWFARFVRVPQAALSIPAALVLTAIMIAVLCGAGWLLWKKTRFD
jgi:hypothetical protein